jgi:hypothetical protein
MSSDADEYQSEIDRWLDGRTPDTPYSDAQQPHEWSQSPLRRYHTLQEPWVYVPPALVETAGDANAGLLLADIARWLEHSDEEGVGPRPGIRVIDGNVWLAKSMAALVAETGLTEARVKGGLNRLQDRGLVERAGRLQLLRPTRPFSVSGIRGMKVYGGFVRMTGDAAPAFILAQLHYWFSPGANQVARVRVRKEGVWWWAKTYRDLAAETGLTERRARSAVACLRRERLIETTVHRFAGLSTIHMRFNEGNFCQAWEEQWTVWWEGQAEQRNRGHVEL